MTTTAEWASSAVPTARGKARRPLALLFWCLVALLLFALALVGSTLWLDALIQSEDRWIRQTVAIREDAMQTLLLAQRAETSQRGYLLTGRDAYLSPYDGAVAALPPALSQLAALLDAEPGGRENVARLRLVVTQKIDELQRSIEARKSGSMASALTIVNDDSGLQMMAEIRQIISAIRTQEDHELDARQSNLKWLGSLLQFGAAGAFIALCAAGLLAGVLTRRAFDEMAAGRDRLAAANGELLKEIAEREKVEAQLRQSQKMEAIGQLTGGIAHDFNNMLAVIAGNLDLVNRRLAKRDFQIQRFVDAGVEGARRAAALTHRLLAFARQQSLSPASLDANQMILGMSEMLRSTLGEQVRIETILAAGLWKTRADAPQLESAILNIALNARDAMPEGGRLTIETANAYLDEAYCREHAEIEPGQYVMVAVSDTGVGMSMEIAARAFDPFFTTKAAGAGTGLGLSQVFGFVKQSKGHIKIYSEVGQGTSLKIYLPRETTLAATPAVRSAPQPEAVLGGTERVLVVEDDPAVRRVTVEALNDLGYTVFSASGASEALTLLESQPVDLLLTDIVMPEVNGKRLADEAARDHPNLKVLFMTGYTRNAVVHGGFVDPGVQLIGKPFTLEQLAGKVRVALSA